MAFDPIFELHKLQIPEFSAEDATREQAFSMLHAIWEKKHPKKAFPVLFRPDVDSGEADKVSISVSDVTGHELAGLLAQGYGFDAVQFDAAIVIEPLSEGDKRHFVTVSVSISKKMVDGMGLKVGDDAQLVARLERFRFNTSIPGIRAEWSGLDRINFRSTPEECTRFHGLMLLLRDGVRVAPPEE